MSDYDMNIHTNPDAKAWAEFYKKTFPDSDEDLMLAWFANAMMAMHDHLNNTKIQPLETERQQQAETIKQLEQQLREKEARIGRFESHVSVMKDYQESPNNTGERALIDARREAVSVLNESRRQSLSHVRAEAVEPIYQALKGFHGIAEGGMVLLKASDYNKVVETVNQIRQQADKG